jgi:hypothetical protein
VQHEEVKVSAGRQGPSDRALAHDDASSGSRASRLGALVAVVVFAGAAVLASQAFAQEPDVEASEAAGSDLAPSGTVAERSAAELTPRERVDRAKELVAGIERSAQSIQRQLQTARKDRDVVRVLCLNDKLNQVDVAQRSAQDRMAALDAAAQREDMDRSRHEYTVLEVLADRVRVLVGESNQCIGEETGYIGEAEVSVSIDPNLPDGDTGFNQGAYSLPPPPNISSPIE